MSVARELRAAAIDRLRGADLGFRDVRAHPGRYTVDDLQRLLRASPALAISIVNGRKPILRASGQVQIALGMAAVVVTKAGSFDAADDDALDLALAVMSNVSAWVPATSVRTVRPAVDMSMEPIGGDDVDKAGLSVWAVMWSHDVLVGIDAVAAGGGQP